MRWVWTRLWKGWLLRTRLIRLMGKTRSRHSRRMNRSSRYRHKTNIDEIAFVRIHMYLHMTMAEDK